MKKQILIIFLLCAITPVVAIQVTDFSMSGAALKEKKTDSEIWVKDDGTVITVFKDRSEALMKDGSRIIKYADGRREAYSSNGDKIIVDEAKGVREYNKNGKTMKMEFTAKTPFGEPIARVVKKILKDPVEINLIYVPEKSDELLYPPKNEEKVELEAQIFFDMLYDSLKQKFINDAQKKKTYNGKPFDIQVSYCRYCKTGYCYEKPRMVTVDFVENGHVVKTFTLDGMDLRDKSVMKEFVKKIVSALG